MEREEIVNIDLPQWELLPDIGLYMDQVITLMDRTFSPALPQARLPRPLGVVQRQQTGQAHQQRNGRQHGNVTPVLTAGHLKR